MKGIILAGGTGTRLYPLTVAVSKQLLPIYDKPLIYYPISLLMLIGIREILMIVTPTDLPLFKKTLGDGSQWGIRITYGVQEQPRGIAEAFIIGERFIGTDSVCLVLGDNIFYGREVIDKVSAAKDSLEAATIFGYIVTDPERYGVPVFDEKGDLIDIEEKPKVPQSNYAITGIYLYTHEVCSIAKSLLPSQRGELEITDLNNVYLKEKKLSITLLGRGSTWLDTGTPESMADAAQFVEVIEKRQGLKIACLEEIAYANGFISKNDLQVLTKNAGDSDYGRYLRKLITS